MKILLIEDERKLADFLVHGFKYEGYSVDHIQDGIDVLKQLKKNSYNIIILDLILPFKNGDKILDEIRQSGNDIPIIVITGVDDTPVKTKILNSGADDYIVKPFSFVELMARIKSVLRRSKNSPLQSQELIVGDLVLNATMRTVSRKKKPIKLRLKEYILLEYFMQNPDKVINRVTLIENVWDYNSRLFSNTIDSHISLLRKKINQGFEEKLIDTVHGVGYILKSKES